MTFPSWQKRWRTSFTPNICIISLSWVWLSLPLPSSFTSAEEQTRDKWRYDFTAVVASFFFFFRVSCTALKYEQLHLKLENPLTRSIAQKKRWRNGAMSSGEERKRKVRVKWHGVSTSITGEERSSIREAGGSFTERRRTRWESSSGTIICASKQGSHVMSCARIPNHKSEIRFRNLGFTVEMAEGARDVFMWRCRNCFWLFSRVSHSWFCSAACIQALTHFREQRKLFLCVELA